MDETSNPLHPEAHPEPATADELAAFYLRGRDVPCHECGYNRRDGTGAACPECGVAIEIDSDSQHLSPRAAGTIRLALVAVLVTGLFSLARNSTFVSWMLFDGALRTLSLSISVRVLWSFSMNVVLATLAVICLIQMRRLCRDRAPLGRLPLVTLWTWLGNSVLLSLTSIVFDMLGM
ncbi:MAG: hypothetical protein ACI89L_000946 [Phycisphaerales bacterium]|jgi:hypothetical protein